MDSKHQFKKKYKYTTELVNQTKQTPNKNIVLVHKLHSVLTSFKCKKSSYKLYSIIDIFWGILNALNTVLLIWPWVVREKVSLDSLPWKENHTHLLKCKRIKRKTNTCTPITIYNLKKKKSYPSKKNELNKR